MIYPAADAKATPFPVMISRKFLWKRFCPQSFSVPNPLIFLKFPKRGHKDPVLFQEQEESAKAHVPPQRSAAGDFLSGQESEIHVNVLAPGHVFVDSIYTAATAGTCGVAGCGSGLHPRFCIAWSPLLEIVPRRCPTSHLKLPVVSVCSVTVCTPCRGGGWH